ncbi:chorismate-binding protein [Frankia sp. Cr2]|uniref:chorismate-binding protein n=1 Tax=Frankia sp. Cr2 TaxID=3073932 RepID=UPI002AD505C9|nr:chorismate-binding protein [Frankia sp. Cr2]
MDGTTRDSSDQGRRAGSSGVSNRAAWGAAPAGGGHSEVRYRPPRRTGSFAVVGGRLATGVIDITDDLAALDRGGFWAVAVDFEGTARCVRFGEVRPAPPLATLAGRPWQGPPRGAWTSSLDGPGYTRGVRRIRAEIAAGEVYQVNLCRVQSVPVADDAGEVVAALAAALARDNPAPYAAVMYVPEVDIRLASASPELFLSRRADVVRSGPIKGTGRVATDLWDKDVAENIMIVDLVRNDLGRVARIGGVSVLKLCTVEAHPGLVHLVSTVQAQLRPDVGWPELFAASFPPGSVSGAPKSSALRVIGELEPSARGPYCGAIGWVDAEKGLGELAVGIRTFWFAAGRLHFGSGAGITWSSDPWAEWREAELKAGRLLRIASSTSQ